LRYKDSWFCDRLVRDNNELCSITNASSIEGWVDESEYFAYCGAKGAIISLTRSGALYCGENNLSIRINAILPGYVNTSMSYDEVAQNNQTIEEFTSEVVNRHPIGYLGTQMILHMVMYTYLQMRLNL
jgi:NAD(P)-dependent dehydrogenase (short-subunit alcohol dehydrogenase family)